MSMIVDVTNTSFYPDGVPEGLQWLGLLMGALGYEEVTEKNLNEITIRSMLYTMATGGANGAFDPPDFFWTNESECRKFWRQRIGATMIFTQPWLKGKRTRANFMKMLERSFIDRWQREDRRSVDLQSTTKDVELESQLTTSP